jgi:hypothetical protein
MGKAFIIYIYITYCKAGFVVFAWKNVASVFVGLLLLSSIVLLVPQTTTFCHIFFLHIEKRKVSTGPNEISVLRRSKPHVFQISNFCGQTLRLNMFHVHEDRLYGYNIQRSLQHDQCLWMFKKYLHEVRYSRNCV